MLSSGQSLIAYSQRSTNHMNFNNANNHPFVSVIVPVYNDEESLEQCLNALTGQTYPRDAYEIIVVDNGSEKSPESMVRRYSSRYIVETKAGSYAARNHGIELALGEILAFTDADCIPAPTWIERGVQYLCSHPSVSVVGGKVEVMRQDRDRITAIELYDSLNHFDQERFIKKENFSVTANLFTWKKVVLKVGPFDDRLKSFGDIEWGKKVVGNGHDLAYAEDVVIQHPAKKTLKELGQRSRRLAGGNRLSRYHNGTNFYNEVWLLARHWLGIPVFMWRRFNDPRLDGLHQRLNFLGVSLFAHLVKGVEEIRLIFQPGTEERK